MLETYMNRIQYQDSFPNIMSLNIVEFVSKYSLSQNEFVCRGNEVIEHFQHTIVIQKVKTMDYIANTN